MPAEQNVFPIMYSFAGGPSDDGTSLLVEATGFDGNTMLAAEKGLYWRNELQWPVFNTGQTLYAGIDYGRVFGPNTAFLTGTQLAGAAIGIRGGVPANYAGLSYDLSAGTPLYKPSGFPTARVTVAFRLSAQF